MALFIAPITKEGKKDVSYNLLLCTNKVLDFEQNSSGSTVFYYYDTGGRRYKAIEYTTSLSKAAFHSRIREAANEQWINVQYIEKDHKTETGIMRINVEHFVRGRNYTHNGVAGYSYIWIDRGSNESKLRLLTTHTIEDISRSSSRSASLSPS